MIKTPQIKVLYNKKDITRSVTEYLSSVTIIDRLDEESDEVTISVEDKDGKWRNSWYPEYGAALDVSMGYGTDLSPLGAFQIDEIHPHGSSTGGDYVDIKGLSAFVTAPFRTKRKQAYKDITLKRLATTIANRAQMTVSGIVADVTLGWAMQMNETDLAFLKRIAGNYGYVFSIKSTKLVFTQRQTLNDRDAVLTLLRKDFNDYNIVDASGRTFAVAKQKYYDPATGKSEQYDKKNSKPAWDESVTESFVENRQQAELKAMADMTRIQAAEVTGTISLKEGNPLMVAGNNVRITKLGKVSGIYLIESSTHVFDSGGYRTDIDVVKVKDISPNLY